MLSTRSNCILQGYLSHSPQQCHFLFQFILVHPIQSISSFPSLSLIKPRLSTARPANLGAATQANSAALDSSLFPSYPLVPLSAPGFPSAETRFMASHSWSFLFITLGVPECNISPPGRFPDGPAVVGLDSVKFSQFPGVFISRADLYHCVLLHLRASF